MISAEKLMKTIIKGRLECYVKKSPFFNPYERSVLYDWEFRLVDDNLIFTDAYRGFNPYSGVEYVYEKGKNIPVWSCDYVGYAKESREIMPAEIYSFLKEARKNHLCNCGGSLIKNHVYENGPFKYETFFQGDIYSVLQVENIYFSNILAAQQISAGKFKTQKALA